MRRSKVVSVVVHCSSVKMVERTGNCLFALPMLTVLRHVGMLVFFTSLSSAQAFSTGSALISSCSSVSPCVLNASVTSRSGTPSQTHSDSDQHACPLDLSHVRDRAGLVRLKAPRHFPTLPDNGDPAIVGSEKQAIGTSAQARDLVALDELPRLFVGEGDLSRVEEVERLPLEEPVSTSGSRAHTQDRRGLLRTERAMMKLVRG